MRAPTTFRIGLLLSAALLSGCLTPQISAAGLGRLFGPGAATGTQASAGATAAPVGTAALGASGALPTALPSPVNLQAQCSYSAPAATPATGGSRHGSYAGLLLPNGWDNLESEAAITAAIAKFEAEAATSESAKLFWACFNKFYVGALTIYRSKAGGTRAAAPSFAPSYAPSYRPSTPPSHLPTTYPSYVPSFAPTAAPADDDWDTEPSEDDEDTATAPDAVADAPLVEVFGVVYDADDVPLAEVEVTVRSMDAAIPYSETTYTGENGYYDFNAPAGVLIEVVVKLDGRSQRRYATFEGELAQFNFGGEPDADDPVGENYPL